MNPLKLFAPTAPFAWISQFWKGRKKVNSFVDNLEQAFGDVSQNAGSYLTSFLNSVTGAHLTGQQVEQNEMQMQNIEDQYQRQVSGMQSAGLNPALLYQSGASGSAPSAPSNSAGNSMSDLMNMLLLPMQLKNLRSDVELKSSEAKVNEAQAQSIGVNTSFNEETFALRKEALQLSNNLTREQVGQVNQLKYESIARMHQLEESALTEASKRAVNQAQEYLYRMEAQDIVALQPYKIELTKAQTSAQKASAALSAVNEAYQRHLLNSGYIEGLCNELEARAAQYGAEAEIKGITSAIRGGHVIPPADFGNSKVANILEGIWNGVFTESVNSGIAVMANLLDYMPSVLLNASPGSRVSSSTPLIYGPEGQTVSRVIR